MPDSGDPGLHLEVTTDLPPGAGWSARECAGKRGPGSESAANGAPGGAPPRSQEEAARLASVPGWFAAAPGASQAPAFPGAPSPRFGDARDRAKLGRAAPRERGRLS